MRKKAKTQPKFDPNEIPGLLEKAKAGDIVARDELLYRFQRLIATLVNVCLTGRPNLWSSYQKTFLRLFGGKNTPPEAVAKMLEKALRRYEKEEIFTTGQLAVLLAIERCNTNLASTIVTCFKDLIYDMIKAHHNNDVVFDECTEEVVETDFEEKIALQLFLEQLDEDEWQYAHKVLMGLKVSGKPPEGLKAKLAEYMDMSPTIQ